jgi:hypothetical protein
MHASAVDELKRNCRPAFLGSDHRTNVAMGGAIQLVSRNPATPSRAYAIAPLLDIPARRLPSYG